MDNSFIDGLFHKQESGAVITVECFNNADVQKIMNMIKNNLIYINPNAGGTSKISEALSLEVLQNIFNFKLERLETEISYESLCENGRVCVDFSGNIKINDNESKCFVSVTRLTEFLHTINNQGNKITYDDVVSRILHKFIGFTNVIDAKSKYVHEYVTDSDIGTISVETVVHNYSECINVLFIWVENNLMPMVKSALDNQKVSNKIKEYNVTIILAPTNSSLIMYEDRTTLTTDEYYKNMCNNAVARQHNIFLSRIEKARKKQYRALYNILRAVRHASNHIISVCPRKKVLREIAQNNYCILYRWIFAQSDKDVHYGLFRNYYISNLIHILQYTQEMKLVDPTKKRSLVEILLGYYNKKGTNLVIKYLKGKDINKETGKIDLVGAIVIFPQDTNVTANDIFDFG